MDMTKDMTKDKTNDKICLSPWRKGVTEAARVTGRSKAHISRVLRGLRKPGKDLARALRSLGLQVPKEGGAE